jgi:tRNA U34 5-methylaminomethyl-2-thiouridine-forming methyltransferase MnmC
MIEGLPEGILHKMHSCPWEEPVRISKHFTLYKEKADFRSMQIPSHISLVYFDAFSPDKQPELWSLEVFEAISKAADKGAVLVTYSAKGDVRRLLNSCGFAVSKPAGPPGKREMIRAIKR